MRLRYLLLLLATCSDDKVHHLADAPNNPDAPPDGPSTGVVTLTVTVAGVPNPNVTVYFQNADSSLVSATQTDASGVASATMQAGGYVTAIKPDVLNGAAFGLLTDSVATFAGVKPGDFLTLATPVLPALPFTITTPLDSGASTYFLWTSCGQQDISAAGSGSGTVPVAVNLAGCGDGTVDMLVETRDGTGPLHGLFQTVVVTPNQQVNLTNNYMGLVTSTFAYTSVPAAISSLGIVQALATTRGQLNVETGQATVTTGAANASFLQQNVTGATAITTSSPIGTPGFGNPHVVEWGPYAAAYTLDLANVLLGDWTTQPTFDVPTHAVTWGESAGATPDLGLVEVDAFRGSPALAWRWRIAAPRTGTTIVYPVLPAPSDIYNVTAGDSPGINTMITAAVPGGYDAVRAHILSAQNGVLSLVVGATGRIVFEDLRGF
jgi:hypothetical protein